MLINPHNLAHQQGIGLIEVLISTLLLAVAVLGFSALQLRVAQTTEESLLRSDALMSIRAISESMRLYPEQKDNYINAINAYNNNTSPGSTSTPAKPQKNCISHACTQDDQTRNFAYEAQKIAADNGLTLAAMNCPSTSGVKANQKVCLVVAWGNTTADMNGNSHSCAKTTGAYSPGATCFIMETY